MGVYSAHTGAGGTCVCWGRPRLRAGALSTLPKAAGVGCETCWTQGSEQAFVLKPHLTRRYTNAEENQEKIHFYISVVHKGTCDFHSYQGAAGVETRRWGSPHSCAWPCYFYAGVKSVFFHAPKCRPGSQVRQFQLNVFHRWETGSRHP